MSIVPSGETLGARSIASHLRHHCDEPETAGIIECLCDQVDRQRFENERLRGVARYWRRKYIDAITASAMSAGTAETPQAAQGEARQRDGEAGTPNSSLPDTTITGEGE